MRLQRCSLTPAVVVSHPLRITRPEEDWVVAREQRQIPDPLFQLYTQADFLSFGAAEGFLAESSNVLFGYFGMLMGSIKDFLLEGPEHIAALEAALASAYDPGKKARGETWDRNADKIQRRALRNLAVMLIGTLDTLADLVALFFTARIRGLSIGRGQFTKIETWLLKPLQVGPVVVTPQEHFLGAFHRALAPCVHPSGPDKGWLPLLRLVRNKAAHMGEQIFPFTCLHDSTGTFYTFLPRRWPYIIQEHITPTGAPRSQSGSPPPDFFETNLMHQDILAFAKGALKRVFLVVENGTQVLGDAYTQFRLLPTNNAALQELNANAEAHDFLYFPETDASG
jgi:hypothetical protein